MIAYTIKDGDTVLGTFSVVEVSDAAIAGGVTTALSLPDGTAVSVHATTGDNFLVIYGSQIVTVEAS